MISPMDIAPRLLLLAFRPPRMAPASSRSPNWSLALRPRGEHSLGPRYFIYMVRGEHPSRLVASVILSLLRGERARCTHGRQVRDFMHVEDVASAFVALLDSGVEGIVNIGSGKPITIRTLVFTIAESIGVPDLIAFGAIAAPLNDPPLLIPNVSRLRDEVGWAPRWTLTDGLADTVDWWRRTDAYMNAEA